MKNDDSTLNNSTEDDEHLTDVAEELTDEQQDLMDEILDLGSSDKEEKEPSVEEDDPKTQEKFENLEDEISKKPEQVEEGDKADKSEKVEDEKLESKKIEGDDAKDVESETKEETVEDSTLLEQIQKLEAENARLKLATEDISVEGEEPEEGEAEKKEDISYNDFVNKLSAVKETKIDITDEEQDKILGGDKEALTNMLTNVRNSMVDSMSGLIPEIFGKMLQSQYELADKAEEFYKTNSELKGFEEEVGMISEALESKYPKWSIDKLHQETAKVAKIKLAKLIEVNKKTESKKKEKKEEADFGKINKGSRETSGSVVVKKPTGIEAEIEELVDDNFGSKF